MIDEPTFRVRVVYRSPGDPLQFIWFYIMAFAGFRIFYAVGWWLIA